MIPTVHFSTVQMGGNIGQDELETENQMAIIAENGQSANINNAAIYHETLFPADGFDQTKTTLSRLVLEKEKRSA